MKAIKWKFTRQVKIKYCDLAISNLLSIAFIFNIYIGFKIIKCDISVSLNKIMKPREIVLTRFA